MKNRPAAKTPGLIIIFKAGPMILPTLFGYPIVHRFKESNPIRTLNLDREGFINKCPIT